MNHICEIQVFPSNLHNDLLIRELAAKKAKLKVNEITDYRILRRSIDARKKRPVFRLRIELFVGKDIPEDSTTFVPRQLQKEKSVLVIGAGPAGYFAALQLIQKGIKPIVIDRGKDVRARRRDLRAIQQFGVVNPDSNYCFGEGGAGTYSDGKLYTRSHKRGRIEDILKILVEHGATKDILIDAHPHIGSNKLPGIIAQMRDTIESNGGEIHFNTKFVDFEIINSKLHGIKVIKNDIPEVFKADACILATGHSARDVFELCDKHKVEMEAKAFALGVRIEHPQALIDEIQYNQRVREENLPASSYRLACQIGDVGVFSFCMCPGGLIVPAATSPGELVVNGMSLSKRDSPYSNSGVVTEISLPLLKDMGYSGVFSGVNFQSEIEKRFFDNGDGSQKAPAQRMTDFIKGKSSRSMVESSYIPGVYSTAIHQLLPKIIYDKIATGLKQFGGMMNGYVTEEALVVGLESRTSSPVRIMRDRENLMSTNIEALFPCGEGAGYAGGILSAAMDGRNVATAVVNYLG